ncbi:hypothetical protein IFM89_028969 [Coptis chinensis]|uniref:Stress-response A/B barrel domain-containing protein n=1 Tax=Coptis chinensis TaxID=261450 RepID=A0A835M1I1_9MAGN|nr:hypothetical protein IFM89_028969 [Coptis chinensis]
MSETIEHIVLVKIKDNTNPSKINSMINALHALSYLDGVLHLTAGPIHTIIRSPSFNFTHMLHGRYKSKNDLRNYSLHPEHLSVANDIVNPICDDIMVLNWVAHLHGPIVPPVGAVMRVSFFKLQEDVLKIVGGIKDRFGSNVQITFGENFSPAKAKGFSIGLLVIFPGFSELEAFDLNEKVRGGT